MEYQKIVKLLDDTTNQPYKFRTRNWVEINDEQKEIKALSFIKYQWMFFQQRCILIN